MSALRPGRSLRFLILAVSIGFTVNSSVSNAQDSALDILQDLQSDGSSGSEASIDESLGDTANSQTQPESPGATPVEPVAPSEQTKSSETVLKPTPGEATTDAKPGPTKPESLKGVKSAPEVPPVKAHEAPPVKGRDGESSRHSPGGSERSRSSFALTGEEAPVDPIDSSLRVALDPARSKGDYSVPLETLKTMVEEPAHPLERDLALTMMGFLGDTSHLEELRGEIRSSSGKPLEALPILALVANAYGTVESKDVLFGIVDRDETPVFQRLWALEILALIDDSSRIAILKKIASSSAADTSDRLRCLQTLADLGDDSMYEQARKLSGDNDLFRETRTRYLVVMNRMKKGSTEESMLGALKSRMSLDEKLALAISMSEMGITKVRGFLLDVVDFRADSVFTQLRALHALALLGDTTRHKVLHRVIDTKTQAQNSAHRILVLMGDRSRVSELSAAAESHDLDAIRTLVLARVMDDNGLDAAGLMSRPRFRSLIVP